MLEKGEWLKGRIKVQMESRDVGPEIHGCVSVGYIDLDGGLEDRYNIREDLSVVPASLELLLLRRCKST